MDTFTNKHYTISELHLNEQSSAPSSAVGQGKLYVLNDSDNSLNYIDDTGVKHKLSHEYAKFTYNLTGNGGDFNQWGWTKLSFNTTEVNTGPNITLSSNEITLTAGTYKILTRNTGVDCHKFMHRLYNKTDSSVIAISHKQMSHLSYTTGRNSIIDAYFTLSGTKTVFLEANCGTSVGTFGLGRYSSFSGNGENAIYNVCYIQRISD